MLAQLAQRLGRRATPPPCQFQRQHFDRAVHADRKDLFDIGDIGVNTAMFDIGAKTPDRAFDHHAVVGVRANLARQA